MDTASPTPAPDAAAFTLRVCLWPADPAVAVPVGANQTLLLAMLAEGVDWPRSCRNGTCRTCLGRLTEGQVRHTVEWPGLSAEEKAEGYVLPCVALPLSDTSLQPP